MHLSRIFIFPIKSLDGMAVESARITKGGILEHDRTYALFDERGLMINAKRTAQVHTLRSEYDADFQHVTLGEDKEMFALTDTKNIEKWMTSYFGFPIFLRHNPVKGFPDDAKAYGPTIVAEESLREVAKWFPGLDEGSIRCRFRTNLEIGEVPAFWEDHLYGAPKELKPFQIGDVAFLGHGPCQRCVVPTRDAWSGQPRVFFRKTFTQARKATLPEWADVRHFKHFFRFTVNTSLPKSEEAKILKVGDLISL